MEFLSYISAIITIGFGIMCFAAPAKSLDLIHLQTKPARPEAVAEGRGTLAGFYLGVGLLCVITAAPVAFLALALGWIFTAFGRFVSIFVDDGKTRFNVLSGLFEFALGLFALPAALSAI